MEENELDFLWIKTWIPGRLPEWTLTNLTNPGKPTSDDIKKHLANKHQFEADETLSLQELENLHRRLHENEDSKKALV